MKVSAVAKAVLVSSASVFSAEASSKVRNLQTVCSCSPRAFSFTLLLAQDCSVNTLDDNPGISDTTCAIVNATTDAAISVNADDQMIAVADVDVPIEEIISCIPWLNNCEDGFIYDEPIRNRELQAGSPIPSVITSIQFIELDSDGTVIQIDDSQNNIDAVSGDSFSYASEASQLDPTEDIGLQLDIVPKTAVLFMVGFNDDGDEIRGRFVWEYTNGCGNDELTITGSEDYGWISFDQVDNAIPEFCPALSDETPAPSPAPFLIDMFPTPPPMVETPLPTPSPTIIDILPTPSPGTPEPTPFPVVIETPTRLPTDGPSSLFFPSFSPTLTPTVGEIPTPSPVIIDFFPTESPSDMGGMPTTQRPISDEPTYSETDTPTYFESPEPTTEYGYGEHYIAVSNSEKKTKSGKKRSSKTAKSESKSGKGSKKISTKSGKSGKSGKGGKSHKGNYDNGYHDNGYGYERRLLNQGYLDLEQKYVGIRK